MSARSAARKTHAQAARAPAAPPGFDEAALAAHPCADRARHRRASARPKSRSRSSPRSSLRCARARRCGRLRARRHEIRPVADRRGRGRASLAHSASGGQPRLQKGHADRRRRDRGACAGAASREVRRRARLEPGDVDEDEAAAEARRRARRPGIRVAGRRSPGGSTSSPSRPGCCVVERAAIDRLNAVDEAITVATLAALSRRSSRARWSRRSRSFRSRSSAAAARAAPSAAGERHLASGTVQADAGRR